MKGLLFNCEGQDPKAVNFLNVFQILKSGPTVVKIATAFYFFCC